MKRSTVVTAVSAGVITVCVAAAIALVCWLHSPSAVDGGLSSWSEWSSCLLPCGGSLQERRRTCTNPVPEHGGKHCEGVFVDVQKCNMQPCPIMGSWGDWNAWAACPVTCGGAGQNRSRLCDSPPPQHGGKDCPSPAWETQACGTNPCPIDGRWSEWSPWSSCSVTCGYAQVVRTRSCSNPEPSSGGHKCEGQDSESESCAPMTACCLSANTDHVGDDIGGALAGIPSSGHCQQECTQIASCRGYVYDSAAETCQLKSDITAPVMSVGKELGARLCGEETFTPLRFCFTHEDVENSCTQSATIHSASPAFSGNYYYGPELVLENKCNVLEGSSATYYIGESDTAPINIVLDFQCLDYISVLHIKNTQRGRSTSNYAVAISDDANTWTQVHEGVLPLVSHLNCDVEIFDIPVDQVTRYVKLDMLSYYGAGAGIQYFNARPACKPTVKLISAPEEYLSAGTVTSLQAGSCITLDNVGSFKAAQQKDFIWKFSCAPTYIDYVEIVNGNLGDRAAKGIQISTSYDNGHWDQVAAEILPDTRNQGEAAPVHRIPIGNCGIYLKLSITSGYGQDMELHRVKINTKYTLDSSSKDRCGPHLAFITSITKNSNSINALKDSSLTYPGLHIEYPDLPEPFIREYSCGMHYRGGALLCDTTNGNCYHHKFTTSGWRLLDSKIPQVTKHGQISCAIHHESEKMFLSGGFDDVAMQGPHAISVGSSKTSLFRGDTWSPGPDMDVGRRCHGSVFISENEVLIAGGANVVDPNELDLKSVQLYNTDTGQYEDKADLIGPNSCPRLEKFNVQGRSSVIAVGGFVHYIGATSYAELYDIATNKWTVLEDYPVSKHGMGLYTFNGVLYVLGGLHHPPYKDLYKLTITGYWKYWEYLGHNYYGYYEAALFTY